MNTAIIYAMKENERIADNTNEKKQRIRERYKGVDPDSLEVIPALPPEDFFNPGSGTKKRVAVYARVSTDDPRQTSSYELQQNHYTDLINQRGNWELVDIYADEGISGTSLKHRDAFIRMIQDCRDGNIDIVVTKSISRFARNVVDCVGYIRQLAALTPPVGIYFETEGMFTLDPKSEMMLSFMSTLAQEESHTKSDVMNSSIEMRFKRGIFLTPPLLGYDNDENGNLVLNEEEAKTVKLIFFMYLFGHSTSQIAKTMTQLKRRTKKGNLRWSSSGIIATLQNERYCGDVLARKTFTPNYLDHKSKKNRQDRNQYRKKDHHEAIVSRDDFIAVQRMISNSKYGNRSFLPELHVVTSGVLRGFISINPRWAGFKAKDYMDASASAYAQDSANASVGSVKTKAGDFDFRGFEVARAQFFNNPHRISVTFSINKICFSTEAVRRLPNTTCVELLVNTRSGLFAVRPAQKDIRNAVQWSKKDCGDLIPRYIAGTAFLPTLYELFDWNSRCKYRVIGLKREEDKESVLIFNLNETEILVPSDYDNASSDDLTAEEDTASRRSSLTAYPPEWMEGFGRDYYGHTRSADTEAISTLNPQISAESFPYRQPELKVTDIAIIRNEIQTIIADIRGRNDEEERAGNG